LFRLYLRIQFITQKNTALHHYKNLLVNVVQSNNFC
jgi:hypothetical protein